MPGPIPVLLSRLALFCWVWQLTSFFALGDEAFGGSRSRTLMGVGLALLYF